MDKNLKAELSALRTEFNSGLGNLQAIIQSIDTKLKQADQLEENCSDDARPNQDLLDDKAIMERFMEASHWNDLEHDIFTTFWNKSRAKRIDTLELTLATLAGDINRMMPSPVKVRNVAEAEDALQRMIKFDATKSKIVELIQKRDRTKLNHIKEQEDENNFIEYYWWLNDLVDDILALKTVRESPQDGSGLPVPFYLESDDTNVLVNNVIGLYRMLIDQHEMEMYELNVIDPMTFEIKVIPEDKLRSYRGYCLVKYNKDLKRAYEHVAKRNGSEVGAPIQKSVH